MTLSLDWKFLFIAGLLGLTVAALWLLINGSRERGRAIVWSQFRTHLGIALLISAITILFVSLQLEPKVQGDDNALPKNPKMTLRQSDHKVESVADESVIDDPINYFDIVIDAQLEPGPGPNPSYSVWDWNMTFNVQNISDSEIDWQFSPSVASDLARKPDIYISKPVVTEAGPDGNRVATYMSAYREDRTGIRPKAWYETTIKLKPKVVYQISIARHINDPLDSGRMSFYFNHSTKGVQFNLAVNPKLFAIQMEVNYHKDVMVPTPSPASFGEAHQITFKTDEKFNPNQGLQVYWTYRGAKPMKAANSAN